MATAFGGTVRGWRERSVFSRWDICEVSPMARSRAPSSGCSMRPNPGSICGSGYRVCSVRRRTCWPPTAERRRRLCPVGGAPQEQKAGPGAHRRRTMDQTVEKTIDRLSDLLDRANKAAQDLEVKDRLTDAVAALRRTRLTQDEDAGIERFVTGLLIGVAVGFGLALLLAPKTGEEMRDDLMQRGIELRDRAGELASRMPFGDGEQGRTEKAPTDQPGIA